MGSVFKKTVTRPLPPGAEIITARGCGSPAGGTPRGRPKTAPLTTGQDGAERIRDESSTYFARYRDGNGIVVEVPTGCRDETAARQVLADLERRAERVRAGLLTPAEDRIAEHLATPIGEHVAAYIESMKPRGVVAMHRDNTRRHLDRFVAGLRLRPARRPEARGPRALARRRRTKGRVGPVPQRPPDGPRSPSPTGASTGRPALVQPVQGGAQGRTRRPTPAAAAGR